MKISEVNLAPIYFNQVEARGGLLTNGLSASNFSSMLNSIIVDQTVSTKDAIAQKTSDASCDCDSSKKCKCDSDKETEEVAEAKKSGMEACTDCSFRKSGQCDLWNGEDENGAFDLFSVNSHDNVAQTGIAKILDIQAQLNVIAKTSSDYDYTNAYTYVDRKKLGILMSD